MSDKNSKETSKLVNTLDVVHTEVYSSLAYHNFPEGSINHPNIMKATVHDIPRIRTWTEFRRWNEHEDLDAPCLFYQANGEIKQLLDLKFSKETVALCNEKGLHIFLYEPLCLYYEDDPIAGYWLNVHNYGFYTEFPREDVNGEDTYNRIRATELDSIGYFLGQNKLYNVIVHTGDYNVEKACSAYNGQMTLLCDDPFLNELIIYDNADPTIKRKFTKHFVCTCWRFTSIRAILCAILKQYETRGVDSNLIWFFDTPVEHLLSTPWMNVNGIGGEEPCREPKFLFNMKQGIEMLNKEAPITYDVKASSSTHVFECAGHHYPTNTDFDDIGNPVVVNPTHLPLEPIYREVFVDVCIESRYGQPTSNISEKVLQAIQFKTPFILVAPPYTLKYMHELGYKSFGDFWDESYDLEEDHLVRTEKIVEIMDYISGLSLDECHALYLKMWPILQYNFRVLAERSRLGRITHIEKTDKLKQIDAVAWAQPEGETLQQKLMSDKERHRDF
ncbi:hypothetical protein N9I83_00155 [bacterium]|nr:hypothetical protein [bacterium]